MAQSFCSGCIHWQQLGDGVGYRFYACVKHHIWEPDLRKKICGGKDKEMRE